MVHLIHKKSTRHDKITGDFGENLACYFLSKFNYEVSIIDHVGIDLIAYNKKIGERIGISVKSRSREVDKYVAGIDIGGSNYNKVIESCKFFDLKPWFCFIVDEPKHDLTGKITFIMLSMKKLIEKYPKFSEGKALKFSVSDKSKDYYQNDKETLFYEMNYTI